MIRKLLRLAAAGTVGNTELAQALQVTQPMVQQMIELLEREGYLHSVVEACSSSCDPCPLQPTCRVISKSRLWVLTEKGAELSR